MLNKTKIINGYIYSLGPLFPWEVQIISVSICPTFSVSVTTKILYRRGEEEVSESLHSNLSFVHVSCMILSLKADT